MTRTAMVLFLLVLLLKLICPSKLRQYTFSRGAGKRDSLMRIWNGRDFTVGECNKARQYYDPLHEISPFPI